MSDALPDPLTDAAARSRLAVLASSFRRLTGRELIQRSDDVVGALWRAPRAILAHGLQDDPVFFFGNRLALQLFEMTFDAFTALPSRLSAEPLLRDERARLLERVACSGFIDDYAGVRISASGRRFRIERAIVWNLVDEAGRRHGQAATFDSWSPVP